MTTTTTTPSTNEVHQARLEQPDRVSEITDDVVELGTLWARYGLSIGRSALETSARTLTATARLLGHVADALEPKKQQ